MKNYKWQLTRFYFKKFYAKYHIWVGHLTVVVDKLRFKHKA